MAEIKEDYRKEFIERTLDLLKKLEPKAKEEKLEFTFLLNCLLGLIVAVL